MRPCRCPHAVRKRARAASRTAPATSSVGMRCGVGRQHDRPAGLAEAASDCPSPRRARQQRRGEGAAAAERRHATPPSRPGTARPRRVVNAAGGEVEERKARDVFVAAVQADPVFTASARYRAARRLRVDRRGRDAEHRQPLWRKPAPGAHRAGEEEFSPRSRRNGRGHRRRRARRAHGRTRGGRCQGRRGGLGVNVTTTVLAQVLDGRKQRGWPLSPPMTCLRPSLPLGRFRVKRSAGRLIPRGGQV